MVLQKEQLTHEVLIVVQVPKREFEHAPLKSLGSDLCAHHQREASSQTKQETEARVSGPESQLHQKSGHTLVVYSIVPR